MFVFHIVLGSLVFISLNLLMYGLWLGWNCKGIYNNVGENYKIMGIMGLIVSVFVGYGLIGTQVPFRTDEDVIAPLMVLKDSENVVYVCKDSVFIWKRDVDVVRNPQGFQLVRTMDINAYGGAIGLGTHYLLRKKP